MTDSQRDGPHDTTLGMDGRICRRDFLNSTLLASGSLLLGPAFPAQLLGEGPEDDWTGPGGVGDYRDANGNTAEVMNAAHRIRDHAFDAPPLDAIDTAELFDCVIAGGGVSGLGAALAFKTQGGEGLNCLVMSDSG
jgi:spermidine dehydrogenase